MELFFFGAVATVVAVFALVRYLAKRARSDELSRFADARGWRFSPERDHGFDMRFPVFACLSKGDDRYAYNVIEGKWRGRPFVAFDCHYATGSGKSREQHEFSAVVLTSEIPLKRLTIGEEGLIHRIGAFFGYEDINFESAEFSRTFRVTATDRRWAYDVLHTRAIEFLLRAPRYSIDMAGLWLIAHRDGNLASRFSPAEFESALNTLTGLLNLLPDYVVEQQRASGGSAR